MPKLRNVCDQKDEDDKSTHQLYIAYVNCNCIAALRFTSMSATSSLVLHGPQVCSSRVQGIRRMNARSRAPFVPMLPPNLETWEERHGQVQAGDDSCRYDSNIFSI